MTFHPHIDLLTSLSEMTERLHRSRGVLERAIDQARDVQAGTDGSGTITVLVDGDGNACDVQVAPDWRRRLPPAQVGAAVVAADGDVAAQVMTATLGALTDQTVRAPLSTEDAPRSSWLVPEQPMTPGTPRSLSQLREAVFAAVDDLDRVIRPPSPIDGTGASGAVRIRMEQGRITACEVDQAWLARQDDITLARALREAVCSASTAALAGRSPTAEYQQRLGEMIADARATLAELNPGGTA